MMDSSKIGQSQFGLGVIKDKQWNDKDMAEPSTFGKDGYYKAEVMHFPMMRTMVLVFAEKVMMAE